MTVQTPSDTVNQLDLDNLPITRKVLFEYRWNKVEFSSPSILYLQEIPFTHMPWKIYVSYQHSREAHNARPTS